MGHARPVHVCARICLRACLRTSLHTHVQAGAPSRRSTHMAARTPAHMPALMSTHTHASHTRLTRMSTHVSVPSCVIWPLPTMRTSRLAIFSVGSSACIERVDTVHGWNRRQRLCRSVHMVIASIHRYTYRQQDRPLSLIDRQGTEVTGRWRRIMHGYIHMRVHSHTGACDRYI